MDENQDFCKKCLKNLALKKFCIYGNSRFDRNVFEVAYDSLRDLSQGLLQDLPRNFSRNSARIFAFICLNIFLDEITEKDAFIIEIQRN